MRQNIKLLTQNCCEGLLTFSSKSDLREKYNQGTFDATGLDYVKIPTKYFIDDDLELGIIPKDDCISSIIIFKQLMNLNRVQANDKRLWSCLTHTRFYNYTTGFGILIIIFREFVIMKPEAILN